MVGVARHSPGDLLHLMVLPPCRRSLVFGGSRLYCSILLRLRLSFELNIGLDVASFPSPWAYPYFIVLLYRQLATGLCPWPRPKFVYM